MKGLLKRWLHSRGWRYSPLPSSLAERPERIFSPSLADIVERLENPDSYDWTFVQIGAFDAVANDSLSPIIKRHSWRGLIVEPQPAALERARAHFADYPMIQFAGLAIGNREGEVEMYLPASEDSSQIASFNAGHVLSHLNNSKAPAALRSITVTVRKLKTLLSDHGLTSPDVFQIDAEGQDYNIVRQIELTPTHPRLVRYEHSHMVSAQQSELVEWLSRHGFRFVYESTDTIAYRPSH